MAMLSRLRSRRLIGDETGRLKAKKETVAETTGEHSGTCENRFEGKD